MHLYVHMHAIINHYLTSAQGQQVFCRATSNCSDNSDLGQMTAEDCCLNTPSGLGFAAGEVCSPCIGKYAV